MSTYSLLNVAAAISGPGGAFSIGSDSGIAEEGFSIEPAERNSMTIGGGGAVMHSLSGNKSAQVTLRLLKTSPVNQQLQQLYDVQVASSVLHGQNLITIADTARGDITTAQLCAFKKKPTLTYATAGGMMEWTWDAGVVDTVLGSGN